MADFKGGRGKKVSYETQMYRIPTPLRPTVERLGMQFRLLWDGLVDPTGEKLISRLNAAIPDPEQLADDNGKNQISGKSEAAISDIKYAELEDKLALCDRNCDGLRQENQRLLADAAKADAAISQLLKQLEDQAKLATEEIERLQSQSRPSANPEAAITLLQDALLLKANSGGAIKRQIEKALEHLT